MMKKEKTKLCTIHRFESPKFIDMMENIVNTFVSKSRYNIDIHTHTDQDIVYYKNAIIRLISNLNFFAVEDELLVLSIFWIVIKYEFDTFYLTASEMIQLTNSKMHPHNLVDMECVVLFRLQWSICQMIEPSWNIDLLHHSIT